MSTVEKGDALEAKIYALFDREIKAGRFFAKPQCCKIFRKRGYYSKQREGEIIFDIAIEITRPGGASPSMLYLIECKNYSSRVPVSDVEEFFQKVQQVGGARVKAIVASTSEFQSSAFIFAQGMGMGLLRYFGNSRVKWVLERSPSAFSNSDEQAEVQRGMTTANYRSRYFDFYCFGGSTSTNSLSTFFLNLTEDALVQDELVSIRGPVTPDQRLVQFLPKKSIEGATQAVLDEIGYASGRVPLDRVSAWQEKDAGLNLVTGAMPSDGDADRGVLGRIRFQPLEITIYQAPDARRQAFTLAHELGHHFLEHSRYMAEESCEESDLDVDRSGSLDFTDFDRMEWQANYFASCLLLPEAQLLTDFRKIAKDRGIVDKGFGELFLDDQPCNRVDFFAVTGDLMAKYGVSQSVVRLRLERLGVLNDARSKPWRIGDLI